MSAVTLDHHVHNRYGCVMARDYHPLTISVTDADLRVIDHLRERYNVTTRSQLLRIAIGSLFAEDAESQAIRLVRRGAGLPPLSTLDGLDLENQPLDPAIEAVLDAAAAADAPDPVQSTSVPSSPRAKTG